jgi:hypothetical protein
MIEPLEAFIKFFSGSISTLSLATLQFASFACDNSDWKRKLNNEIISLFTKPRLVFL